MEWDVRHWSIFIFLVGFIMSVMSLCTPYMVQDDPVYFGSKGLWHVEDDEHGHYTVTLTLLIVSSVLLLVALIAFLVLMKRINTLVHIITMATQVLAGILNIAAAANFGYHEKKMKEGSLESGFWLALTSGILFIMNSVFLYFLPYMDDVPMRRMSSPGSPKSRDFV